MYRSKHQRQDSHHLDGGISFIDYEHASSNESMEGDVSTEEVEAFFVSNQKIKVTKNTTNECSTGWSPFGFEKETIDCFKADSKAPSSLDQMQHDSYYYVPLHPADRSIRLLRVLQSEKEDTVECILEHYQLEHAPHYIALSYAWGRHDFNRIILLNNKQCPVRKNL
jgi:hypothetical protein